MQPNYARYLEVSDEIITYLKSKSIVFPLKTKIKKFNLKAIGCL